METGLNFSAIRRALDAEDWQDDREGGQTRSVFLGTVFALTPSGKYYLPFACSNVEPCPQCQGAGFFPTHRKRRVVKKWKSRNDRRTRRILRMRKSGVPESTVRAYYLRVRHIDTSVDCDYCGGCGSREAHLDELWNAAVEEGLEAIGASLESGEGDPCDLFATERRERPEDEDPECEGCGWGSDECTCEETTP